MIRLYITISISIFLFSSIFFWDFNYVNTRIELAKNRRIVRTNRPTLAKKNNYIKEAILRNGSNDLSTTAYIMNKLEAKYNFPYSWGGDIKNHKNGFDCTGFIHGIMYYHGYSNYKRRFNTKSLYYSLRNDKDFIEIFNAKDNIEKFNVKELRLNDIILWPSSIYDGKNISGKIIGHIGIVSMIMNNIPYVTHCGNSESYNNIDFIGHLGSGVNTIEAEEFICLKQRGILVVFRKL